MNDHHESTDNPLLDEGLPAFSRIRPEHALPAVERRLAEYRDVIARIEALGDGVDYESVVVAESLADNALANTFSSISHLHAVDNTEAWREAYRACLEPMTRFETERGHNAALCDAYHRLAERDDFGDQPAQVQAMIHHELRAFRLAGVDLPEDDRRRFGDIALRLSELGNRFGHHVLDATEAYSEHFDEAKQLAGLPESRLRLLENMARQNGRSGWMANLSYPAFQAIITYADDRALRERFYRAFSTRASDVGPHAGTYDNGPVIREMLALRAEQAKLLGFEHHAAARLSTRMADTAEQVEAFLRGLAERARPLAGEQLQELETFAASKGAETPLQPWDIAYYSEKLREERLGITEEMLKPWFEVERVFDGLFTTAGELFGLRFEANDSVETWHEQVRYFDVLDSAGEPVAGLYLDLYARPRKSGGAWMDVCRARMDVGGQRQRPVAFLTCNFAEPAPEQPSLLTHDDVVTIFHEFGHCLHHLLTRIDLPSIAGISGVEWDAVELPSQLMEGWAWEPESLRRFARHVETGQPLPAEMLEGLRADRLFQGAMALVRQIQFALTDLTLHTRSDADPLAVMREVAEQVAVVPMLDDNRFLMSFSHLFDGGYAAGYYSYLWAERLARDAFEVFRERGLFDSATGRRLAREILEVGASRSMRASWMAFREREAALEPLLAEYGVAA
jgi:oligopeptidase A